MTGNPYFNGDISMYGDESSSDSEFGQQEYTCSQLGFVLLLKKEQILLNKSQCSSLKKAKRDAMSRFILSFERAYGRTISPNQVKKKINNMKMELKKKANLKANGAKTVVLKPWEIELTKLVDIEERNQVIQKIVGE